MKNEKVRTIFDQKLKSNEWDTMIAAKVSDKKQKISRRNRWISSLFVIFALSMSVSIPEINDQTSYAATEIETYLGNEFQGDMILSMLSE